jgi:integral membrane protein
VLLALYALFALAAGARSLVQLATRADEAPVAYSLSLAAAATYALGWFAIRRAADGRTGFASWMLWVELAGVVTVGTLSLVEDDWFHDASVWSGYGLGYGFVPAVLPVAALLWLRAQDPARADRDGIVSAFRIVAFAEAASWLGLLVGMFFKYVVDAGEQGVQVFGPIHGTVFVAYVVVALLTWWRLRWSLPVAVLALAASVPPFCTVVFELWADRTGRLDPSEPRSDRAVLEHH